MTKALAFTRSATKSLRSLPRKDAQAIIAKLEAYARGEREDVVRLVGTDMLRLRHGDWRAAFEETRTEIIVLAVAHRREAYR
jgi:mRNA interferase RelE/StbE